MDREPSARRSAETRHDGDDDDDNNNNNNNNDGDGDGDNNNNNNNKAQMEKSAMAADGFVFAAKWVNLNHGSFGSTPTAVQTRFRHYQDASEMRPDGFVRYDYPHLLEEARAAAAALVQARVDDVVLVQNATEAVNTVLRNLHWNADGRDVVLSFSTVYEACANAVDFLVDYLGDKVQHRHVNLLYPLPDSDIVDAFRSAVIRLHGAGKRVRLCIIDVVSSRPGVLFPWVQVVRACKDLGVLSLVDGAQGVGMLPLRLASADPDFFVSNCHKWLFVPRACAIFYVPARNQHLLPTTLGTSHGYVTPSSRRASPLPPMSQSPFVNNFSFVGTRDNSAYLCIKDAIAWRRDALGGEDAIYSYLVRLNKRGIHLVAELLGTTVLDNKDGTLTNCAMGNVALPLYLGPADGGANGRATVPYADEAKALQWMQKAMVYDHNTMMPIFVLGSRYWARISAQVYLAIKHYQFAAHVLRDVSERAARGEYR